MSIAKTEMNTTIATVKILPALNGDCIIVEILGVVLLIDGGYVSTYKEFLKPELLKIAKEHKSISHVIVTHIDGDHISGINKLIEDNTKKQFIPINNVWHNSFRHIQMFQEESDSKYNLTHGQGISKIEIKSYLRDSIDRDKNISAIQGSTLASLIKKSGYKWNKEFNDKAVSTDNLKTIPISSDVKIHLLSPSNEKLKNLYKEWRKELFAMGYNMDMTSQEIFDDAFEFIIAKGKERKIPKPKNIAYSKLDIHSLSELDFPEDTAISNGSSISFILECRNLRLLFLADSHPALIVKSLKEIHKDGVFPIKFDLIKVAHHGCVANTSSDILKIIDSERYIFSTNGNMFGHPDIETIARIISRKVSFKRTLYFNYPLSILDELNTNELKNEFNFDCIVQNGNSPLEISL